MMENIGVFLKELGANKYAVNYEDRSAMFEICSKAGTYYGTTYFSKAENAICMDITLPCLVKKPYYLSMHDYIGKETGMWYTDLIHLDTTGSIVFHTYVYTYGLAEKANDILASIADCISDDNINKIIDAILNAVTPSPAVFNDMQSNLMIKILLLEDNLYRIAFGLPLDQKDPLERNRKKKHTRSDLRDLSHLLDLRDIPDLPDLQDLSSLLGFQGAEGQTKEPSSNTDLTSEDLLSLLGDDANIKEGDDSE